MAVPADLPAVTALGVSAGAGVAWIEAVTAIGGGAGGGDAGPGAGAAVEVDRSSALAFPWLL